MKIGLLRTNKAKEESGVWLDGGEGLKLLIARHNNYRYQDLYRKLLKQKLGTIRTKELSAEVTEEITARATATAILLGWQNLQDDSGVDIAYTPEKAFELLTSHREFLRIVLELSSDLNNYREDEVKEAVKN
jgi:hypothetical protein